MKLPFNSAKQQADFYEERANVLRSISDPNSLKILDFLVSQDNPCISDITKTLDISISAVSHQISKLRAIGVVETKRTGQTTCCSLSKGKNAELVKTILTKNNN